MSRLLVRPNIDYTPNLYKKGETVFLKGIRGIDPRPYKINEVLNDDSYRLSRDGLIQRGVFKDEDLVSSGVHPYDELLDEKVYGGERKRKRKAKSSTGALPEKAHKDHPTVRPEDAVVKRHDQDSFEEVASVAGSSTKPIKQEPSEFEPNMIHEKTKLGGSELPMGDMKMDDIAQEFLLATGEAEELDDTRASLPENDDSGVLGEVSAEHNPFSRVPSHSHEESKWQNLRNLLSKFGIGERPLVDGKKRVRWRCGCGRNLYDDFTELRSGAAAELEKWLNDSMRTHAGSSASNSQQSATLTSAVSPNAGSSGYQQTVESDISLQSLDSSTNVMPASNMKAGVSIDVNLEKCWLILCGNMKRGPDVLLKQMNLSSTPSDKSLFDDMKSVYSNFRQSWTLRSVLRGVKTIRFVQFQLHKSARVDIRKAPDMPPETRRDEYLYESCDLIPPVGEDFMTHWFYHPEDAWEFPWAYSLIPKRLKGELEVNLNQAPRVGWGIQIVEGWLGSRLWLLSLSLFGCGSLAFAICWAVFEHDIQGAFGVSAYVVALLTLAVGAAQANLG